MPSLEQTIAGLRCREVLALLSDYLDELLAPSRLQAVQAHLAACPVCARFGADVAAILQALAPANEGQAAPGEAAAGTTGGSDSMPRGAATDATRGRAATPAPGSPAPGSLAPASLQRLREAITGEISRTSSPNDER